MIRKILRLCADAIFPPRCVACGIHLGNTKGGVLCDKCRKSILIHTAFFCARCKKRRPEGKKTCHPGEKFLVAAAGSYDNRALRELIHAWKYNNVRAASKEIRKIIEAYINEAAHLFTEDLYSIVPTPLYPGKERKRGFNQAREIAGALLESLSARGVAAEVVEPLTRVRNTKTQTDMKNFLERGENIEGSFRIESPIAVFRKNIILVDDVFTSGATMREAARVLKSAGARHILGFVLALA